MRTSFLVGLAAGLAAWILMLRQRLHTARMRGDMYRDVAARLERTVAELNGRGF